MESAIKNEEVVAAKESDYIRNSNTVVGESAADIDNCSVGTVKKSNVTFTKRNVTLPTNNNSNYLLNVMSTLNTFTSDNSNVWNDEFTESTRDNIRRLVNASRLVAPTASTNQDYRRSFMYALLNLLEGLKRFQQESAGSLVPISHLDVLFNQQSQNDHPVQQMPLEMTNNQEDNANHDNASPDSSISSGSRNRVVLTPAPASDRWNILQSVFPEGMQDHIRLLIEESFQVTPADEFELVSFKSNLAKMLWNVYRDRTLHGIMNGSSMFFQNWMVNHYDFLRGLHVNEVHVHSNASQLEMSSMDTFSSGTPMDTSSNETRMDTSSSAHV